MHDFAKSFKCSVILLSLHVPILRKFLYVQIQKYFTTIALIFRLNRILTALKEIISNCSAVSPESNVSLICYMMNIPDCTTFFSNFIGPVYLSQTFSRTAWA